MSSEDRVVTFCRVEMIEKVRLYILTVFRVFAIMALYSLPSVGPLPVPIGYSLVLWRHLVLSERQWSVGLALGLYTER